MNWNWRVIVVVPSSSRTVAEQAARAINSTGPDYEGDAFTAPLCAAGTTEVTHWGLYTSATDVMVDLMASAIPSISGVMFWRHDVAGALVASNVTEAAGQSWGWQQSLDAAGLVPPPPPSMP